MTFMKTEERSCFAGSRVKEGVGVGGEWKKCVQKHVMTYHIGKKVGDSSSLWKETYFFSFRLPDERR